MLFWIKQHAPMQRIIHLGCLKKQSAKISCRSKDPSAARCNLKLGEVSCVGVVGDWDRS